MKATVRRPVSDWPIQLPRIVDSDRGALPHAIGELGAQSTGHAEDIPFGIFDVLAQQVDVGVRAHLMTQHFAHRFTHVQSRSAGGSVPFAEGCVSSTGRGNLAVRVAVGSAPA